MILYVLQAIIAKFWAGNRCTNCAFVLHSASDWSQKSPETVSPSSLSPFSVCVWSRFIKKKCECFAQIETFSSRADRAKSIYFFYAIASNICFAFCLNTRSWWVVVFVSACSLSGHQVDPCSLVSVVNIITLAIRHPLLVLVLPGMQ